MDDSAFVRRALTGLLAAEPGFRVVGEADSGAEALAKIPAADPDCVTLDVAMPGMDGLQVLPVLLRWKPELRVLMLSAHTQEGAAATVAALAAGAVDFIDKTTFNVMDLEFMRREVVDRLVALAPRTNHSNGAAHRREPAGAAALAALRGCDLCVIGASTGGPAAIQHILQRLPARFPLPVVVVQHMPEGFTGAFARRLDSLCRLRVTEAAEGHRLTPGDVVIAPGNRHLSVSPGLALALSPEPSGARHIPSIDVTMRSAARSKPGRVLGILLTGMGEDGADGMATIRAGGGVTIAESEGSCVVYGMPRAAVRRGGATWVLPLEEIAGLLGALAG
ncbi:MAG: chemotaxis-specific protein-glutamate methyltransferase CheB [Gemmatimonadales bacterium]|nr:chemotaxis-specific protein-glutamate methyltransferase CheB [Gemmatimonadales bacterium]